MAGVPLKPIPVRKPVKSAVEEGLEEITVNVQRLPDPSLSFPQPYFTESMTVSRPRFPWSAIIILGIGALLMMRGESRRRR